MDCDWNIEEKFLPNTNPFTENRKPGGWKRTTEGELTDNEKNLFAKRRLIPVRKLAQGSYSTVILFEYKKKLPKENKSRGEEGDKEDDDILISDNGDEIEKTQPDEIMMACKVVDTKRMPKGLYEKFLSREMDILTKMRHPNIIHLYRIFRRKYKIFIFMRFAELGNLCDLLTLRGALKEKYARVWSRQLISGLTYLHAIGVVHRDLKCENVLISNNRRVKIADFGFSKFLEKEGDLCSTYCGSLGYSAPEVLEGKPYDGKCADAWSLGVVIYAMLNRSLPFDTTNPKKLKLDQMNKAYRFRNSKRMDISDEAVALVAGLLEPVPEARTTIAEAASSNWMAMIPDMTQQTPLEKAAMEAHSALKTELRLHSLKRYVVPLLGETLEASSEEDEPEQEEEEVEPEEEEVRKWPSKPAIDEIDDDDLDDD